MNRSASSVSPLRAEGMREAARPRREETLLPEVLEDRASSAKFCFGRHRVADKRLDVEALLRRTRHRERQAEVFEHLLAASEQLPRFCEVAAHREQRALLEQRHAFEGGSHVADLGDDLLPIPGGRQS
jgi:hypothetical protein